MRNCLPLCVLTREANARGFRNLANYRARILFHCGKAGYALRLMEIHSEFDDEPPFELPNSDRSSAIISSTTLELLL